jgi:NADH:ubiquinone reductase (H+-translocating)
VSGHWLDPVAFDLSPTGGVLARDRMAVSPATQKAPPALDRRAQTKPGPSEAAYSGARASLTKSPCVVIVGGGFAGIEVARALQDSPARVTLIDRHNYTLFQPLLYQVATAALSSADVAAPIRGLLHAANTEVLLDEVIGVDRERSCVRTSGGRAIDFNLLVLATGSQYDYFGHDEWAALAPALKTLKDAVAIRSRLLLAFEQAEMCADDVERRALMTFVVIGAGPTGVEMAGAIAELAKTTLARDFRRIEPASARILLTEAGSKVLSAFPEKLGTYAHRALTRLGIQVMLNTKVEKIDENGVVAGGQRIAAKTVIWGAGVKATPVAAWLGMQSGPHGSIRVNPDFSIAAHPHIFVIGDAAAASGMDGKPLPGLAAVAKQEGKYVGNLIRQRIAGADPTNVFRYRDYGTMATIGRSAAVADLRGVRVTGTVAWLLWGFVHIYFLIGFRNRLLVFVNWCWAWLTYARGSRLITRDEESGSTLKLRRLPKDADEPRASTLSGETGPANAKRR